MSHDVSAPVAQRGQQNAVANARQRVVERREAVGTAHPDYASALIQLALLLIMHGDPTDAEPLLREALDIRRATLGDRHPDYATCLSSLAGLLWARGDLGAAEPLLREALAIRCEVLGERHPKSIVSQNSLDQLLQAKKAWDSAARLDTVTDRTASEAPAAASPEPVTEPDIPPAPVAEPEPAPAVAEAAAPPQEPTTDTVPVPAAEPEEPPQPEAAPVAAPPAPAVVSGHAREDLARAIDELRGWFAHLGGELNGAGERLKGHGTLPAAELVGALRDAGARFVALQHAVVQAAHDLGLEDADTRPAASLDELHALVGEFERLEFERSRVGQARLHSLAALERVGRLVHADGADFPPLRECQESARRLHETIAAAPAAELPAEATALAEGTHPFNALLALAAAHAGLNDEEWANALELVQTAFGKPMSVAAARSKIAAGPEV